METTRESLTAATEILLGRRRTRHEIDAVRKRKLRRLIEHACHGVPYYRRLFESGGIGPQQIRTAEDLCAIPITSKDDLRRAGVRETVAQGLRPERLLTTTTSGSSGEPLCIHRTWAQKRLDTLRWLCVMHRLGMRMRDKCATVMYARAPDPREATTDRRFVTGAGLYRHANFDCCRTPERLLQELRDYAPDVVVGYPGVLERIADCRRGRGPRGPSPRIIVTLGEVLTDAARERIQSGLEAPVRNIYASYELGVIAWECATSGGMHVCDDHLIVEVLKKGESVGAGHIGDLVATNLDAYAMPFIRYRLGDVVTKGTETCPCGQPFSTLRRVQGRTIDYFLLPDGRLQHPFEIVGKALDVAGWIYRYELIQEKKHRIVLHVVPSPVPSTEDVRQLVRSVRPILGALVDFKVKLVTKIEPSSPGKAKILRSRVKARS